MKRLAQFLLAAAAMATGYAWAGGGEELIRLLRHQTDLGSDAGQRGDQATVDSFLDRAVIFSGGDGSVSHETKYDRSDAIASLLKRQTLDFLDAGQQRDLKTMRSYLDEDVLYVDEDGELSTYHDFAHGSPSPPAQGAAPTIKVSDWVLHHKGDVSVASYGIEQHVQYGTQPVAYRFLAVDIWIKRGSQWKLMGSQTIPLHQDPPAIVLPVQALDVYVGAYSAGPGSFVDISRDGNDLVIMSNGGKAAKLSAEVQDVFFKSGVPSGYAPPRIIFHRDETGKAVGYVNGGLVYAKTASNDVPDTTAAAASPPSLGPLTLRDFRVSQSGDVAIAVFFHDRDSDYYGQVLHQTYRSMEAWLKQGAAWKMMSSQGRAIQSDPPMVLLPEKELSAYVGNYSAGENALNVTIAQERDFLTLSSGGKKAVRLQALARNAYFVPGSPRTTLIFSRDSGARISGYISRREGRDVVYSRVR